MISSRDVYFIYKALEIAKKRESNGRVKICSFICKGNRVISQPRINNYRKSFKGNAVIEDNTIGYHSEMRTIRDYLNCSKSFRSKGLTLYVSGVTINNNPVISSKPCTYCMEWVLKTNIKRIVFSTRDNKSISIKELNV